MNFSLYDILARLVPGVVLYLSIWMFYIEFLENHSLSEIKNIPDAIALLIIFVLGHINDAISSSLEQNYFRKPLGSPTVKLLKGEGFKYKYFELFKKEKLHEKDKIIEELIKTLGSSIDDNYDKAYSYMHRIVSKKEYKRVEAFTNQYYFSRNMHISLFISGIILLLVYFHKMGSLQIFKFPIIHFIVIIIWFIILIYTWIRTKHRNIYLIKEVMKTFLSESEAKQNQTPIIQNITSNNDILKSITPLDSSNEVVKRE